MDYLTKLKEYLELTVKEQASDLHFSTGHPPLLRINGKLVPLVKYKVLTGEEVKELGLALLNPEQQKRFAEDKEVDFSCRMGGRFSSSTVRILAGINLMATLTSPLCRKILTLNLTRSSKL